MCTLVLLHRPGHSWPLLVAGNRDEMRGRAWAAPARHWPDRPEVIAGRDELAGGSWFGINDHGIVAVVLNREGSLGPQTGMRSRGELVLEALDHSDAHEAAWALTNLNPAAYRPFNLFIGDAETAVWLANREGSPAIGSADVQPGLHMLTAGEIDDAGSARIRHYLPRFAAASAPDPLAGDWAQWQALLGSQHGPDANDPLTAMTIRLPNGFQTCCSHCVALPADKAHEPKFLFAAGPPDMAPFKPVTL